MTPYRSLIEAAAQARNLDPNLVEGLILQESSGNTFSWNPEPRYRYLWNVATHQPFRPLTFAERASEEPPTDFPFLKGDRDQEWWAQQASWGLMQIMGATAREENFRGRANPEPSRRRAEPRQQWPWRGAHAGVQDE
jgi:hypothetical protein